MHIINRLYGRFVYGIAVLRVFFYLNSVLSDTSVVIWWIETYSPFCMANESECCLLAAVLRGLFCLRHSHRTNEVSENQNRFSGGLKIRIVFLEG